VPSGNTRVPSGRIRVPSGLTMVPSGNRRDPSGRRTPPRELPELSPVRLFVPVFGGSIRPPLRLVLLLVPVGCDVGLLTRGRFVPIEEMALFLSPPPVLELLSALPLPSNFGGSANTGAFDTVVYVELSKFAATRAACSCASCLRFCLSKAPSRIDTESNGSFAE